MGCNSERSQSVSQEDDMENKNSDLKSLPRKPLSSIGHLNIGAFLLFGFATSLLVCLAAPLRISAQDKPPSDSSVAATTLIAPEAVYPGVLTTSDPIFNRPVNCSTLATAPNGSAVRYDAIPFTVAAPGTVTMSFEFTDGGGISPTGTANQGPDTFLVLYAGTFSPASPLTNCFAVNDDINAATNRRSRISTSLAVGSYTAVVTSFRNVPINATNDDVLPWNYNLAILGVPTYGATDFLVADFAIARIAIFDQNLVFKSYLDSAISGTFGLDFLQNGNVAAVGRNFQEIRFYNPLGVVVGGFTGNVNVSGNSQDMKVSSSNLIYVGPNTGNIPELNMSGTKLRGFGNVGTNYSGIALLPGNKMWGNQFSGTIEVFDLSSGTGNNIPPTSTFSIANNGQTNAGSMSYSASTNTVLMANNGGDIFERNSTTGAFIRKFLMSAVPPGTYTGKSGVTRGPGGDVYTVTNLGGVPGSDGRIVRFNGTTGAFVSATDISTRVSSPTNIIWAGNVPALGVRTPYDFDGDRKTDISIFRPAPGEWWINRSSNGTTFALQFGASTDKIAPADYTGDGKADIAFWRPSTGFWFILRSEDFSFFSFPFGTSGDIPTAGDFDGDGKADPAVFRPSDTNWYIARSSGGATIQQFGVSGDAPVPADYDGDGRADIAIYRPSLGQWWVNRSSNGSTLALQFGAPADKPVQGDYTGDGKADIAFWRPSTGFWFVLRSEDSSFFAFPFGLSGDLPTPGDYDGDGKFDAAIFRPSDTNWYVQRSTAGILIQQFGISSDRPIPNAFVP